jgi:putative oxidoreductase
MQDTTLFDLTALSAGLLALRLVLGLGMAAHASQKLFGWFGGHGLAGTGSFFEMLGFRPGRLFAAAAGVTELASGLLVATGFLGPIGPALMISVMVVAMLGVHWKNGYFAQSNGIELTVMFAVGAAALAFTGYGAFSLDAVLGLAPIWTPTVAIIAIVAGIAGGLGNLALRRTAPTAPPAPTPVPR